MLHLAIIGIACAVSALNEDIAFIERKNNELNKFCLSEEGRQNIAKTSRVYDVDVHNSSDCGGNKIANRTSSFFYDYIINRCQGSRNNSCSIMENVSLKRLKNSDADFAFKKRQLLWDNSMLTLRPSVKNERSQNKEHKVKLKKYKRTDSKSEQLKNKKTNSGLSHKEKKLFLRLKNLKSTFWNHFGNLDMEKRVEKFCKKIELENQLEEDKLSNAGATTSRGNYKESEETLPKKSVLFFNNHLNDKFSLRKRSFRNKHHIVDSNSDLFSVNPVTGKSGYTSIHDTPKTVFQTLPNFQFKKNRPYFYSDIRDLKPTYRKNLFAKPYPYSAGFKSKLSFLYPKQKFIPREKRKRNEKTRSALRKSRQKLKNWPFIKDFARQRTYKGRQKRREKLGFTENNSATRSPYSEILRKEEITETAVVLNPTQKYEGYVLPDHTIEKPFLKRDFQSQKQESHLKTHEDHYGSMTDFPLYSSTYNHFYQKYSDQTSSSLPFSPSVKVRRALRKCLTHHILQKRKKRCGIKLCSAPRKCWRSAPLLCIPYIRKGQEDILKYLIQVMQKMLGKPFPSKQDIFGKTKFKPDKELMPQNSCDDSYDDDYETESTKSTIRITPWSTKGPTGSSNKPTIRPTVRSSIRYPIGTTVGLATLSSNDPNIVPTVGPTMGLNSRARLATTIGPNNEPYLCRMPQTTPPIQRKSCLVGSPDCTPPPSFPITSNLASSHCNVPANFVIPRPPNNTWLTTTPGLGEITTQNLNQLSNQPLLSSSTISSTPESFSFFSPNGFNASSKEVDANVNVNSSAALYSTESITFTPEVTEALRFDAPCVSAINPISLHIPNSTEYSKAQLYQDLELNTATPSSKAPPEFSNVQPYQDPELGTLAPYYTLPPENSKVQEPYHDFEISTTSPSNNALPEYSNEDYELSNSIPLNQDKKIPYPSENPQPIDFDLNYEDFGNSPSTPQGTTEWISVTTPSSSTTAGETCSLKHNKSKNKAKSHKCGYNKHSKNKKGHFEDYLLDEDHTPNKESKSFSARKKKVKAHKKKLFKENLNLPEKEYDIPFDYNSYDLYPLLSSNKINKKGHKKHSKGKRKYHSRKEKYRKMKDSENQNSLARRKREDDYIWPDIYSDYFDESIYEDKSIQKRSENSTTTSKTNSPDQDWISPFYDMFSEMAKAVSTIASAESETKTITTSEQSEIIKTNETHTIATTTPSADNRSLVTTTANTTSAITSIKSITDPTVITTTSSKAASASTLTPDTPAATTTLLKATGKTASNKTARIAAAIANFTAKAIAIKGRAANITKSKVNGTAKTSSVIEVRFPTTTAKNTNSSTASTTYKNIPTNPSDFIGGAGAIVDGFGFTAANVAIKPTPNADANNSAISTTENTSTATTFITNHEDFKSKNIAVENHKTAIQNERMISENEKPFAKHIRSNLSLPSNDKKNFSLGANSSHLFKIGVESIIGSKYNGKLMKQRSMDNSKAGKKSFFQANFKGNSSNSESSSEKNSKKDSGKEEKTGKGNQDLDVGDGQAPTTLKAAVIVKGSKKMLTKPSPKVYSRVYPDSFNFEIEANETVTTTMTTANSSIENKTALLSSTLKPDTRLQLLAVCEGYLEIIKRVKVLNQTFGENLDAELAQYCESIISQSFNSQLEKPKKSESNESSLKSNAVEEINTIGTSEGNILALPNSNENNKEFSDSTIQEKIADDTITYFASKKQNENGEIKKNLEEGRNLTKTDSLENPNSKKEKKIKRKKHCKKNIKKKKMDQKDEHAEEGILKRGISEEQLKLIHLLKKRKRALLSWLINSKDQYKSDDLPETEYFDDEDFIPPDPEFPEYSGTIKPKRNDNSFKRAIQSLYHMSKASYPVYAQRYGYNKDGEIREVEVLWREVNEKTHEQKVLKNISVIAFLMTSTSSPSQNQEEATPLEAKEYEEDVLADTELKNENKVGFANEMSDTPDNTTPSETEDLEMKNSTTSDSTTVTSKPPKKNETHLFISKPDPSLIVGTPPNKNKTHQNITRKVSHKYEVAKDFVQEYSIEFLNYAVYILPAMFTILFFFCCFGCALYILKTRKSFKKGKKKKKTAFISDETTETTDEFEDSRAKRKRENKRKKKAYKDGAQDANSENKTKKKFWNVLKMPVSSDKELNEDNGQNERKSFLKFLKGKKVNIKAGNNALSKNYPDSGDESPATAAGDEKETYKGDANSEAVERRELISLLEELKKIELEQTGEKKEVKSVHVQYAIQEEENPFRKGTEFSYPFQKNVFGLPKGYFFCNKKFPSQQTENPVFKDWELYRDVSEMSELLPCKCNYYADKKDYYRHFRLNQEGECNHIYKIYRNSGVNKKPFGDKNFMYNEDEKNKNFIYNKHRSMNSNSSEEFVGVNKKNVGTEVRLTENSSPVRLLLKKNTDLVEQMKNMKHHLNKKKYVRLKDEGVLCRL